MCGCNPLLFLSLGTVSVVLHRQAGSVDVIKACTHALVLEALLFQDVAAFSVERDSLLDLRHRLQEGDGTEM